MPGPMPMPGPGAYPSGFAPVGFGPGGYGPGGFGPLVHRVMSGETLFSISRLYRVNPWEIARANGLFNPNLIFAGQVLCIPGPGPAVRM